MTFFDEELDDSPLAGFPFPVDAAFFADAAEGVEEAPFAAFLSGFFEADFAAAAAVKEGGGYYIFMAIRKEGREQ